MSRMSFLTLKCQSTTGKLGGLVVFCFIDMITASHIQLTVSKHWRKWCYYNYTEHVISYTQNYIKLGPAEDLSTGDKVNMWLHITQNYIKLGPAEDLSTGDKVNMWLHITQNYIKLGPAEDLSTGDKVNMWLHITQNYIKLGPAEDLSTGDKVNMWLHITRTTFTCYT